MESKAAQELRQATAWSTPLAECAESVLAELSAATKQRADGMVVEHELRQQLAAWSEAFGTNDVKVATNEFDQAHQELATVTATLDIERKELAVACEDRDAAMLRAETAEKQLAAVTMERELGELKGKHE